MILNWEWFVFYWINNVRLLKKKYRKNMIHSQNEQKRSVIGIFGIIAKVDATGKEFENSAYEGC